MIEHAWSVLCSKCITDPETKNPTLVEVIENVQYPSNIELPALAPLTTDLVSCWFRANPDQPARGTGRITIVRPNGTHSESVEYGIDLTAYVFVHAVTRSGGFQIAVPGMHFFQVELKLDGQDQWKTVGRIPLQVAAVEALANANVGVPVVTK